MNNPTHQIIRLNEVMHLTGLSRSSIYAYMSQGIFPKSVKLGKRAVGWLRHEIDAWVEDCIREYIT